MGEVTRFNLVRDVQRREPAAGSVLPLLPGTLSEQPQLLVDLGSSVSSEGVAGICSNFLADGGFVSPDSVSDHPLGRLSAWLRARDDRVTVDELVHDSPLAGVLSGRGGVSTHGPEDDLWVELRVSLAESLLVAMLQEDADPSVAPALNRLLLVAGLAVALWLTQGGTDDDGDDDRGGRDEARSLRLSRPESTRSTGTDTAERERVRGALHLAPCTAARMAQPLSRTDPA